MRAGYAPRSWSLWRLPAPTLAFVLAVDVLGIVTTLAGAVATGREPVRATDLVTLGLLTLGQLVHVEAARHVERLREIEASHRHWVDLKSVWSFAGLLLLPLMPALVLVLVTFVHTRIRVATRTAPHQTVFSGMTVLLGTTAGWAVLHAFPPGAQDLQGPLGLAAVLVAALTRWTINHGLVCGVLRVESPSTSWFRRFFAPTEMLIGLGSLAVGTVVAALATTHPWLIPIVIAPIVVMHRGLLMQQLMRAVHTDAKTGLATAARWHARASRVLTDARRKKTAVGVLMVDLDDFKAVNDRWGHLAGDHVLRAVADLLTETVEDSDAVGRFGGEEFVVLIENAGPAAVTAAAERVRARTTELAVAARPVGTTVTGLSVSVGTAVYPDTDAADLDDLLLAADAALYDAKRAGRNRVRAAPARGR